MPQQFVSCSPDERRRRVRRPPRPRTEADVDVLHRVPARGVHLVAAGHEHGGRVWNARRCSTVSAWYCKQVKKEQRTKVSSPAVQNLVNWRDFKRSSSPAPPPAAQSSRPSLMACLLPLLGGGFRSSLPTFHTSNSSPTFRALVLQPERGRLSPLSERHWGGGGGAERERRRRGLGAALYVCYPRVWCPKPTLVGLQ